MTPEMLNMSIAQIALVGWVSLEAATGTLVVWEYPQNKIKTNKKSLGIDVKKMSESYLDGIE